MLCHGGAVGSCVTVDAGSRSSAVAARNPTVAWVRRGTFMGGRAIVPCISSVRAQLRKLQVVAALYVPT